MAYPTNPIYKLCKDKDGNETCIITTLKDENNTQLYIPFCEDNTDYIKYKLWLEEGNTPEAAD
tara:strand:- start:923 stop:1111 length:189 start_codon:yes stop_codon:yes gene_type:complete